MITTIIEDMDGKLISKQTYPKEYNFNVKDFNVKNRNLENDNFLDELDFAIGVLKPDLNKNDFYVEYLNKEILKYFNISLEDVKGSYLFESLNFLRELNILDMLLESFIEDNPLKLKVLRYIENILVSSNVYEFFRFKNNLYFKINSSNDLDILNKSNKETIKNSKLSVGIMQGNKWVYGNDTFLEMYGTDLDHIRELDLINRNIIHREFIKSNELKYVIDDILNRKQFFFQDKIEFNHNGQIQYLREILYPTSFNNQPAIEVIFIDLTDERKMAMEFNELIKKLEVILKLGKISVCQINDGKIYWSNEIYSIFEIPPEKLNINNKLNTFKEFFDIIKRFIIKTDLEKVYNDISIGKNGVNHNVSEDAAEYESGRENEDMFSFNKDEFKKDISHNKIFSYDNSPINIFNTSFRIKTRNGNIKMISCKFLIFSEYPLNLSGFTQDISYQSALNKELNMHLVEYGLLYQNLEEKKLELESKLENKSDLLEETYNNLNNNLNLFLYLLSSYLDSNIGKLDTYYKIIKKRIEILYDTNKAQMDFKYFEELEFKEFIENYIAYYFKDYLDDIEIRYNISNEFYLKRIEIDFFYLILFEYLFNIIDISANPIRSSEISLIEKDNKINIIIKSRIDREIEIECLDILRLIGNSQKTRFEDISVNKEGKHISLEILISKV